MIFRAAIERYQEVTSTMDVARERAASGALSGTTIMAATQTAGRGRQGRTWVSPPGACLAATVILRPPPRPDGSSLAFAGLLSGIAACLTARELGAAAAVIKWPNDILVGSRKLCGILSEAFEVSSQRPAALVGFGMNLAARATVALPSSIETRYVGLADLSSERSCPEAVLARLLINLKLWYERWTREGSRPLLEAWPRLDGLHGSTVDVELPAGRVRGVAVGIAASGALRVDTGARVVEVLAGDVIKVGAAV